MFTGIIKELGTIKSLKKEGDKLVVTIISDEKLEVDDSISVNGVCSTVISTNNNEFVVEYMPESLKITDINKWAQEDKVNLEPPLAVGDKINGHFVQGHIDTTGKISKIENDEFEIAFPKEYSKYIALKGSISVDGISLTISEVSKNTFKVSLISHTLKNTTLGFKKVGDLVNIEVDMMSRYLKRLFDERDNQTDYEFLKERGFI
ncbi:riboflavin synthase [Patescibacteria group bacterium]